MNGSTASDQPIDRYTTMGDLTQKARRFIRRALVPSGVILLAATAYLWNSGSAGALAFGLMSIGTIFALAVWTTAAKGVPLMPVIVVQQFLISALPIISNHEIVTTYPQAFVTKAGIEVMVFCCSLAIFWRLGMQSFAPGSAAAYVLVGVERNGMAGLSRLGFSLVLAATAFLALQDLNLIDVVLQFLPNGVYPILGAVIAAASACGFFLLAMITGSGEMTPTQRTLFWLMMAINCLISASSLLLSSVAVVVSSVAIGFFWSTGRIPWRFLVLMAVMISFLNSGKYEMRERYWHGEDEDPSGPAAISLGDMPGFYAEWVQCSVSSLTGVTTVPAGTRGSSQVNSTDQGLLQRLNNLQNILFVIDAMETNHVTPLNGETYAIIPPLLVPRILWPSKPRTHEGQVRLNVHFGRQLLDSTFTTYIAWGLLAEAYGNFGPIKGVILLGGFLGLFFAWSENFTARKPLFSTEGFVTFAVFMGLANSYEMVASVMITSIFQSLIPVIAACAPFVRKQVVVRPRAA